MKVSFYLLGALVLCALLGYFEFSDSAQEVIGPKDSTNDFLESQFEFLVKKYNKSYLNPEIRRQAFENFKINYGLVIEDEEDDTASFGMSKFFDHSEKDFHELYLNPMLEEELPFFQPEGDSALKLVESEVELSKKEADFVFDWRAQNKVNPTMKEQDNCGACWAFATTAALESQYMIKKDQSISLSEQYLVDCDNLNHGCQGGGMFRAYKYI